VLIVVGVALELVDKLQAQLVMKAYDGGGGEPEGPATSTKTGKKKKGAAGRTSASWTKRDGGAQPGKS